MSWIKDLYQTYETNADMVAENAGADEPVLLPISHSTQNAQIEIRIDMAGSFLRAERVPKKQAVTIIPVTEDSAARTSKPCAHPLEDKLEYIAGDFVSYTGVDNHAKYELYLQELAQWSASSDTHPKVEAIETYIRKAQVMEDLIKAKVLTCSPETGMLTKDKIEGIAQEDCFVRFSVEGKLGQDDRVYTDRELFYTYIAYYTNKNSVKNLCYVSGEQMVCSDKHGAKIRNTADKAKLISANDSSGFTYRGRFADSGQVVSVGYDVSQKAHSALRWLVQKQGFRIGEMVVVAWELTGKPIPDIFKSTADGFFDDDYEYEPGFSNPAYTENLELALLGYEKELNANDQIVVMGVEAATTGRLSICFYHKINGSDFLRNIGYWYETCFWRYWKNQKEEKQHWYWSAGSPALRAIAVTAFGDKNDKLLKATMERLLPCIIDRRDLPRDIVSAAVSRVSNPAAFENKFFHRQAMGITCAMIRKSRYDQSKLKEEKEDWNMALDRTETDRSYVFGRLLGAAQKLEEVALFYAGDTGRPTAADRYFMQFMRRPAQTWKIINESLQPYKISLKKQKKTYYEKELQEIYDSFNQADFMSREPLSELYLLGYNCQLNSYNKEEEK